MGCRMMMLIVITEIQPKKNTEQEERGGSNTNLQTEIFNKYKDKYESKHKKKKLNENFQFNKMKDLMKKII